MISLKVNNIKSFMSDLLRSETFDKFLVSEISISTFNTFYINGSINKNYFSDESNERNQNFSVWSMLKPICYELIKGNRTPLQMKIIFLLSSEMTDNIIEKSKTTLTSEQVNSLCMIFKFEDGILNCITGTNLKIFTMDKSLEKFWDDYIKSFLIKKYDAVEQ
ncbi:MAG: DUF5721 family protein [Eubacterium sp.]